MMHSDGGLVTRLTKSLTCKRKATWRKEQVTK